ncbi:MAG: type I methionyl aminopeptidase [Ferruginibacter sp.]|nr:type I methionyl aminopeptidase [Ferruginibacter sp.]
MIIYKTAEEIEIMRKSCLLVGQTQAVIAAALKPGVTTLQLNTLAESFLKDHGATPSFKNYHGYPFATCISVNDAVVHGFPNNTPLKEGDVVSVDIGAYMNGFHGDSAYTFALGDVEEDVLKLLKVTKESLYKGIEKAVVGNRIGDIAHAIQEYTEKKYGYGVVRELVGHGLGRSMHEDPQVPNYGKKGTGPKLKPGMVLAIEPMINLGVKDVFTEDDGWTIRTKDGKVSAHFEHDICIRPGKTADILSSFDPVEQAEAANPNLKVWTYTEVSA